MKSSWKTVLALVSFVIQPIAFAETGAVDKSSYSVFNPTPVHQMREFATDRPDKTESPYTVDAGHFQVESDIVFFSRDRVTNGDKTETISYGIPNFKIGITNNTDLQLIIPLHQREKGTSGDETTTKNGVGDTLVRFKWNVLGNDGGPIAIGFLPFVKVPTNSGDLSNKKVDGGLAVPMAFELPNEWGMGTQLQWNRAYNDDSKEFDTEFISSITFGHSIFGELSGYTEFFSQSSSDPNAGWIGTVDTGLTYMATPNLQLDLGANWGVTAAADDLNVFTGVSYRH